MNPEYLNHLINEHAVIEKGLILLERQAALGENMNKTLIKTLLDYLWDYAELCHNQKEEKIYFPLLIRNGMPPQGPVAMMLQEHEGERQYIKAMQKFVYEFEDNGKLAPRFKDLVEEYLELTKNHIWKENDILYPMGKNFINESDEPFLLYEFSRIEKETVGEGGFLRYQTLINSLEKQYEGKIDLLASLPTGLINQMLDVLPVELSFVDSNDRVRYFNKLDQEKIFTRSLSVIGRTVQQCHPQKSVHLVNKILEEMKSGTREKASFWIRMGELYLYISYYAVRDDNRKYLGCIEMVQDIQPFRELEGDKRLLDEE